ncbi:MAG: tyrosine-type recombinase/integrase [Verrucomicrobiota bacterium]
MRTANTTISELKINGVTRYRVTYPTANGRKRELYVDRKKAEARLKEIQAEQKQFGLSASAMTSTTRADAVAAEMILAGSGLTLVEVARAMLAQKTATDSGKPLDEAAQAFLTSREKTSTIHQKVITGRMNYMLRFLEGKKTTSVTIADIQQLLDGLDRATRTKDNYKRTLVSFFAFCMAREWCASNPASATAAITFAGTDVDILSPTEAAAILAACDPALLPGVVLGMFCGLRSAELSRLQWSAVDLAQGHVTIGAGIAKTGARRVCPIPENAKAWLAPYAQKKGNVIEENEHNRNLWKLARVRAGFGPFWSQYKAVNDAQTNPATKKPRKDLKPWPSNALRHSAISYKLATNPDLPRLAYESGNSPDAIQKHYNGLASPQSAKQFFSISPDTGEGVLRFKAA